jgi:hypothetical protein
MTRGFIVQGKRIVGAVQLPEGTRDTTLPRPRVSPDVIPLDQTPLPNGLAVDRSLETYTRARWNPFRGRGRWPEVAAFDSDVQRLEERQTVVNADLLQLREQHVQAEAADAEAMAAWVGDPSATRPLPDAPAIKERIAELEAERDAIELATRRVLDRKIDFVERHRGKLRREAAAARKEAVAELRAAVDKAEAARNDVVACLETELWAAEFPEEAADPSRLRFAFLNCGRVGNAVQQLRDQVTATAVLAALREDVGWLDEALADVTEERALDPHETAVWEQSPEGRQAVGLANRRLREQLAPRNVTRAGWGD